MSRLVFDKRDRGPLMYVDESEWTTGRLKDEFSLSLEKAPNRKYYEQAKALMFRIPLTEQNPKTEDEEVPFVIDFKDLSSRVQCEFLEYCKLYSII